MKNTNRFYLTPEDKVLASEFLQTRKDDTIEMFGYASIFVLLRYTITILTAV